ncbi:hypothetical protein D3C86_1834220 [compost metagenome]
MVQFGPCSGLPRMNASSTSTRGTMKRLIGMSEPSSNCMSSSSTPWSGSVMLEDTCMAREVRPILWPIILRPPAIFLSTQARWMA